MNTINAAIAVSMTVLFATILGAALPLSATGTMAPFDAFVTTPALILAAAAVSTGLYHVLSAGMEKIVYDLRSRQIRQPASRRADRSVATGFEAATGR